ncbi:MAG TPA: Na(+)/H(+) antiporter subunit D, partial [Rhodobiaceae bacterium]|nr:Na(+)/H(+) antiporter subunit D [Rhodobiaceae bacterium]
FSRMQLDSLAAWAIFIAFGIKCAFPLLHNWMHDAYPAATVSGTVILSVFTTKLAVYALLRG